MSAAELKAIDKAFGKKVVLQNVNFSLEQGEIVGLLGPNGSGKTSIMKILSGMLSPDSGSVVHNGTYRSLIEQPCFYNSMSGYENLAYFSAMYRADISDVERIVQLLQMKAYIKKRVGHYSLGMKQKLGIATALLGMPELLILDEPMNGLDPLNVIEMRECLQMSRDHFHQAILISSHILQEMQELCDRVLLIKNGTVIENISLEKNVSSHIISFLSPQECRRAFDLLEHYNASHIFSETELTVEDKRPVYETVAELVKNGIKIVGVREKKPQLEELYCKYYKEEMI